MEQESQKNLEYTETVSSVKKSCKATLKSEGVLTLSLKKAESTATVAGVIFEGKNDMTTIVGGDITLNNGYDGIVFTLSSAKLEANSTNKIVAEGTQTVTLSGIAIVAPSTVANTVDTPLISTTTTPLILINVGYMEVETSNARTNTAGDLLYSKISGITITPPTDATSDPTFTVKLTKDSSSHAITDIEFTWITSTIIYLW